MQATYLPSTRLRDVLHAELSSYHGMDILWMHRVFISVIALLVEPPRRFALIKLASALDIFVTFWHCTSRQAHGGCSSAVESQNVDLDVAGSNPVTHPSSS